MLKGGLVRQIPDPVGSAEVIPHKHFLPKFVPPAKKVSPALFSQNNH